MDKERERGRKGGEVGLHAGGGKTRSHRSPNIASRDHHPDDLYESLPTQTIQ